MITAASFPTPHLALRSTDPAELDRVRAFATEQAVAAEGLRTYLAARWSDAWYGDRMTLLRQAHQDLIQWRYALAQRAPGRLGVGLALDAARFRTSPRDGGPNYDRLGYIGRLRAGATWDPGTRTYRGGEPTPASTVMEDYGRAAAIRMDMEGCRDVLQNVVRVGRWSIPGNRLARGAAARDVARRLAARVAARDGDTSTLETGGDLMYAVTAHPDDADRMRGLALITLVGAADVDGGERLRAWQDARYLLYQAPATKKGSDAVARVLLVAVGAVLFGRAPVLPHDTDLRAMVLGQDAATQMPGDTALVAALQ